MTTTRALCVTEFPNALPTDNRPNTSHNYYYSSWEGYMLSHKLSALRLILLQFDSKLGQQM